MVGSWHCEASGAGSSPVTSTRMVLGRTKGVTCLQMVRFLQSLCGQHKLAVFAKKPERNKSKEELMDFISIVSRGVRFVNTTPHEINLVWTDGEEFVVPVSGVLVNARAVELDGGCHPSGAALVKTRFEASEADEAKLVDIESADPKSVVLGSIIAAQAFPGRVLAFVPAPGFERVPTSEKKMRADKFTTF